MQIDRITRFSRGYPPHIAQLEESIRVHIFCRDVRQQILPTWVSRKEPHTFEVVPASEELLWKTTILFAEPYEFQRNGTVERGTDGAEVISEFIRHVAGDLAIKGESFWEIAAAREDDDSENTVPALVWISGEVQERRRSIRQSIATMKESTSKEPHIDLPKNKAMIVRLPGGLGTPGQQLRRLGVLEQASTITPEFHDGVYGAERNDSGFQFTDFSSAQFRAMAKAMRSWGWMSTVQENKYATEYYIIERQLRFHQALAELRTQILEQMNAMLKQLGLEAEIRMNGLLTADDISDLITKVREGSISFNQAFEPIHSQLLN